MSRLRIITAGVGTLAVLGLSAGPALASETGSHGSSGYDYSGSGTTGTSTVMSEVNGKATPVKVAAVQITRDAPTQPAGALAFTGSDAIIGGLVLGSGLVVVGGGLVLGGRKKRTA